MAAAALESAARLGEEKVMSKLRRWQQKAAKLAAVDAACRLKFEDLHNERAAMRRAEVRRDSIKPGVKAPVTVGRLEAALKVRRRRQAFEAIQRNIRADVQHDHGGKDGKD